MGVWALHSFHSSRELQLFAAHLNLDVPKRTKCPEPFLHVRHSLTVNLLSQSQAIWTAVLSINRQETSVPLLRLGTSQCGKELHWTSAQTLFFSWDMFTADSSVWSKWFKLDPHIFAYERLYLFSHIAQTLQSYQHLKKCTYCIHKWSQKNSYRIRGKKTAHKWAFILCEHASFTGFFNCLYAWATFTQF